MIIIDGTMDHFLSKHPFFLLEKKFKRALRCSEFHPLTIAIQSHIPHRCCNWEQQTKLVMTAVFSISIYNYAFVDDAVLSLLHKVLFCD